MSNGQKPSWTRWNKNEPNNFPHSKDGEDYVIMRTRLNHSDDLYNGAWNDAPGTQNVPVVCEQVCTKGQPSIDVPIILTGPALNKFGSLSVSSNHSSNLYPKNRMTDGNFKTMWHSEGVNGWATYIFNTEQRVTKVSIVRRFGK